MAVRWRVNGIYKANAETIYNEITSLGEKFTPMDVVNLAKDENTALHPLFEWDDKKAADKYRENQARSIICNIVVQNDVETEDGEEKVFVRVIVNTNERAKTYQTIERTVTRKDDYTLLLAAALKELKAFKKKYAALSSDLSWLFEGIDKIAI